MMLRINHNLFFDAHVIDEIEIRACRACWALITKIDDQRKQDLFTSDLCAAAR